MKHANTFKSITAVLVFFVLGAPAIVQANTASDIARTRATVAYADLNLENEAGAQVIYRRLKRASRDVCGVTTFQSAGSVSQVQKFQQCYRESLTSAVQKIDSDLLTRIHAG